MPVFLPTVKFAPLTVKFYSANRPRYDVFDLPIQAATCLVAI